MVSLVALVLVMAVGGASAYSFYYQRGHGESTTNSSLMSTSSDLPMTSTSLVCTPSSQMVGIPVSCIATVTNSPGSSGSVPTGVVTLTASSKGTFGATACHPGPDSLSCSASFTPGSGSAGSDSITADYRGDSGHLGSTGTSVLMVSKRPTTTSVSCFPSSVPVMSKGGCTARVIDSSGGSALSPSGTVSFSSPSGTFGSPVCTLSGGSCVVSFTPLRTGAIQLVASFAGDLDHLPSQSQGLSPLTATSRTTTASVTCPPSVGAGSQVSCQTTVRDSASNEGAVTPIGNFTFSTTGVGSSFSPKTCTLAPFSTGVATCQVTYTPAGTSGIQAIAGRYGGDIYHSPSNATDFDLLIKARASSTSVSCARPSTIVNTPLFCTVTVADISSGASVAISGNVKVVSSASGTFNSTSCLLHAGRCAFNYVPSSGSEGTQTLTATYSGDSVHASSTGTTAVTVTPRQSSISITCTPSSVAVNTPATCTATVSDATSAGTPITPPVGVVVFSAAGGSFDPQASCSLSAGSCSANFIPAPGSEGSIAVSATFQGDTDHYSSSTSGAVTATPRSVTVSVVCSPSSIMTTTSTTCTVTATDSNAGAIVPEGTTHFTDNGGGSFTPVDCTLVSGTCSVTYTSAVVLGPTSVVITATYSGDINHYGGSNTTTIQVTL